LEKESKIFEDGIEDKGLIEGNNQQVEDVLKDVLEDVLEDVLD
jgi:uncharacterized lipoprotein YajG